MLNIQYVHGHLHYQVIPPIHHNYAVLPQTELKPMKNHRS